MSAAIVWGVRSTDWEWFEDHRHFEGEYLWFSGDDVFVVGYGVVEAAYGPVSLPDGGYVPSVPAAEEAHVRELLAGDAHLRTQEPELFLLRRF